MQSCERGAAAPGDDGDLWDVNEHWVLQRNGELGIDITAADEATATPTLWRRSVECGSPAGPPPSGTVASARLARSTS